MTRGIKLLPILLLMVIAFFVDLYRSALPSWFVFSIFAILFIKVASYAYHVVTRK